MAGGAPRSQYRRDRLNWVESGPSGLFGDFELNRSSCFLLENCRPVAHPAADTHVIGLHPDEIATPELAVDGEVEQSEVAFLPLQLEPDPYGPDIFRLQRAF